MTFRRSLRFLPAFVCMAVIFWFSSQSGSEVVQAAQPLYDHVPTIGKTIKIPWFKVGHVVGYSALGTALLFGFGPGQRRAVIYSLAVTALYAITDEFHQTFSPGRHAWVIDVLIDLGAACFAVFVYELIRRVKAGAARTQS